MATTIKLVCAGAMHTFLKVIIRSYSPAKCYVIYITAFQMRNLLLYLVASVSRCQINDLSQFLRRVGNILSFELPFFGFVGPSQTFIQIYATIDGTCHKNYPPSNSLQHLQEGGEGEKALFKKHNLRFSVHLVKDWQIFYPLLSQN
jgi:hypothetical protein